RPDLEHVHLGPEPEEQQRLPRMTVAVAVAILRRALRAGEDAVERPHGRFPVAGGRAAGREHCCSQGRGSPQPDPGARRPPALQADRWQPRRGGGPAGWVAAHADVRERSSDEPVHITPGRAAKSMRLPLSGAGARPGRATAPPEAKNPAGCGVLLRVRRASADGTAARTQEILEVYFSGGTAPLPGAGVADVPGPR